MVKVHDKVESTPTLLIPRIMMSRRVSHGIVSAEDRKEEPRSGEGEGDRRPRKEEPRDGEKNTSDTPH